jgi:uncharacterized protein YlxP (DUF503 family)
MYVGCLVVEFHIPASASLKDKRSIVKSNIQRAQQRFNASIVELADQDPVAARHHWSSSLRR